MMNHTLRRAFTRQDRLIGDPFLICAGALLGTIGLLSLHGATLSEDVRVSDDVIQQSVFMSIGAVVLIVVARFDYRLLRLSWLPIIAIGLSAIALVLVLIIGSTAFGARRWFLIGGYSLQPSEFAKLATVVAIAAFASYHNPSSRWFTVLLIAFLVPAGLILIEPDLGSALVLGTAWLVLMIAWPLSIKGLWAIAATAIAFVPLAFALAVPGYQRERLAVFFDPERDPLGSGFTLRQVEVALGAGGITGRGFEITESALSGLATRNSDFALAQIGEQFGLVGTISVILGFSLIAWRGLIIANSASDRFGKLLALGLTSLLIVQAMLHIAVNVRLFPATGIPLPFISLGGSSMVAACAILGLLISIASRHPADPLERWSGERWV